VARAFASTDAGLIINPDGLTNQIEGGIIQSTSWTLHEEVKFDQTGILSRDWASYPILTMPDVPKVSVGLINRPEERPLGAGEASQGPTVAAIANAFAHATGRRIRDLPFHPERVKSALGLVRYSAGTAGVAIVGNPKTAPPMRWRRAFQLRAYESGISAPRAIKATKSMDLRNVCPQDSQTPVIAHDGLAHMLRQHRAASSMSPHCGQSGSRKRRVFGAAEHIACAVP